ncbi:MAG: hypothetical protein ACRD2R_04075 [Terriglobales bacterium]
MNCKRFREDLPDAAQTLATGLALAPEHAQHRRTCAACAAELEAMLRTMAVLDEWQAPEPSPYFDSRLRARLREEPAAGAGTWHEWLRRPLLASAFAVLLAAGLWMFQGGQPLEQAPGSARRTPAAPVVAQMGSAVSDLQNLERNQELYADFDLLDDLVEEGSEDATP